MGSQNFGLEKNVVRKRYESPKIQKLWLTMNVWVETKDVSQKTLGPIKTETFKTFLFLFTFKTPIEHAMDTLQIIFRNQVNCQTSNRHRQFPHTIQVPVAKSCHFEAGLSSRPLQELNSS